MSKQMQTLQPIVASHEIPKESREWECPWCFKGLPACTGQKQRHKSIQLHWKTDHPNEDTSVSAILKQRAKNMRELPGSQPQMIEGNAKRSISWTKRHADNRDLKRCGHQLVSFQPEPGTRNPEGWAGNAVYTCTQCWRFGPYSTFRCECKPYRWPKSFFDLTEKTKELLAEKWQTTVATATEFFTKNAGPAIKNKLQN